MEDRLREEEARVVIYLPQKARGTLISKCEEVLHAHFQFILEERPHSLPEDDKLNNLSACMLPDHSYLIAWNRYAKG